MWVYIVYIDIWICLYIYIVPFACAEGSCTATVNGAPISLNRLLVCIYTHIHMCVYIVYIDIWICLYIYRPLRLRRGELHRVRQGRADRLEEDSLSSSFTSSCRPL